MKEATVREIGITEPERTVNSMVTSHNSCILERTQCMQVSTAAMYYHRFYIGNMPRCQLILDQILVEAGLNRSWVKTFGKKIEAWASVHTKCSR